MDFTSSQRHNRYIKQCIYVIVQELLSHVARKQPVDIVVSNRSACQCTAFAFYRRLRNLSGLKKPITVLTIWRNKWINKLVTILFIYSFVWFLRLTPMQAERKVALTRHGWRKRFAFWRLQSYCSTSSKSFPQTFTLKRTFSSKMKMV